jgi:hypothetical protein
VKFVFYGEAGITFTSMYVLLFFYGGNQYVFGREARVHKNSLNVLLAGSLVCEIFGAYCQLRRTRLNGNLFICLLPKARYAYPYMIISTLQHLAVPPCCTNLQLCSTACIHYKCACCASGRKEKKLAFYLRRSIQFSRVPTYFLQRQKRIQFSRVLTKKVYNVLESKKYTIFWTRKRTIFYSRVTLQQ